MNKPYLYQQDVLGDFRQLIAHEAVLRGGPFKLSSGGESDILVDCSRVLRSSNGFRQLRLVISLLGKLPPGIMAVGGPLAGSDPIAAAFVAEANIPNWFGVRKEVKGRGFDADIITGSLRKGDKVLLVEDVCTTGGNLLRVAQAVKDFGAEIVYVFAVVDRGGMARVEKELKVNTCALFTLDELLKATANIKLEIDYQEPGTVLIAKLDKIAKKNHDTFVYSIEIEKTRQGIVYRFVVKEAVEGHEFVTGFGSSIDEAMRNVDESLEEACKQWGYKQ